MENSKQAEGHWDLLYRNATVFDGSGAPAAVEDVAIRSGVIVARGRELPCSNAHRVIEAEGLWLMPGLLDIHTHLDLEVDLDPRLPEVVRHGTTTVLFGNCSLGTCFGTQRDDRGQDPIVDCFTRVENIPKAVLRKLVDAISWKDTGAYYDHFSAMPLGPNVAAFVPHSMLRVEAMGLEAAISRAPTESELQKMEELLDRALEQGYLGLSTDGLPFHYLANEPHTDKRIPTQFASFGELRRLLKVVRRHDRVWQTTPILENRLTALLYFALTSGRLFGKTLKVSALSAMEMALAPRATKAFLGFARLMNSRLFKGCLHFQALGTNFRVWSDGIVSPLYEELPSTAQLIALEYDDVEGRHALMHDPVWVEQFRRDWLHGRTGGDWASFKARIGWPDHLVIRDLHRMVFDGAPVADWDGETLEQVYQRLLRFKDGDATAARSDVEREAFMSLDERPRDDADFMLWLMRRYDKDFRYWADVSNVGNRSTIDYLLHPQALPGFNDSGAHITNMAFFDANLMSLRLADARGETVVAKMVRRLTREPAKFFGLDVGRIETGAQADLVLIDPQQLRAWDTNDTREYVYRELFEHHQMVNRPPPIVREVVIRGEVVWQDGDFTEVLGRDALGRVLRAA
ncbi:MAG: amidohydrolase family protein [Halieaceae bacterium]|jgi:N-acyl-D-aspartate/D-glutamate deacylase|nr:amidohydrolase family protein [Halieaceae bacterium]